jgi:predicted transposase YdaD
MPGPFDVTTKHLVALRPTDWLAYTGVSPSPVEVLSVDLATVTSEADQVLRVRGDRPWLLHLEFQAGYDAEMDERLLVYSVLLRRRYRLSVRSVVVLLRPEADGPAMSGIRQFELPDGERYLEFRFRVLRAWEQSIEAILTGGLATLPMAPLADVDAGALPGVIQRMQARIAREASPDEAATLWTATYLLMGLRYSETFTAQLLQGVRAMKESVTYQAILREGREEGQIAAMQRILLRLGEKRLGPCPPSARAAIESIHSVERLETLTERLLDAENWDELLAG